MTKIIYQVRIKNGEVIVAQYHDTIEGVVDFFLTSGMDIWEFIDTYDIWTIEHTENILAEFAFFLAVTQTRTHNHTFDNKIDLLIHDDKDA